MNTLSKRVERLEDEAGSCHCFLFADRTPSGDFVDISGVGKHETIDAFVLAAGKDPETTTVICWETN